MSISSIGGTTGLSTQQVYGPDSTTSTKRTLATDLTTSTDVTRQAAGASRFASAISDALASLGVSLDDTSGTTSGTSADATTSTDGATSDALSAFMHDLFTALHGQSHDGSPAGPQPAGDASAGRVDAAPAAGTRPPHGGHGGGHHGGGRIESDLDSLIQEVSSSTTSATSTDTTATTSSSTTNPDLTALETSFDALLATTGAAGNGASLSSFLDALASKLQDAPSTGNMVATQA